MKKRLASIEALTFHFFSFTVNAPTANSQRGQRVSGAQGPINGAFGQKVGAGHLSSKTAIDLVVVSEAGSGVDTLTLLR